MLFNDLLPVWKHIFANDHKNVRQGSGSGWMCNHLASWIRSVSLIQNLLNQGIRIRKGIFTDSQTQFQVKKSESEIMNKRYTGTGTSRQQTSDMADFAHWSDSIVWSLEIPTYERAPKLQELQYTVMVHASVSDPDQIQFQTGQNGPKTRGKKEEISCFNSSMQGWRLLETEGPFYGSKTKRYKKT